MSVPPIRVNDGSHNVEIEIARDYVHPFFDRGDDQSFEVVVTYSIDKDFFRFKRKMSVIITPFGPAYLVEHGDAKDRGDNLFEYELTYASIPARRTEGASVSFTQQWWKAMTSTADGNKIANPSKYFYNVDFDIEEQQFTVAGEIEYEYFTAKPAPLIRPRVYLLFGLLRYVNAPNAGISGRIVVEDSEVGIYKGGIFFRKTVYANTK